MNNKSLPQNKIQEIRANFDFFDTDNNGCIDLEEFAKLLKIIEPKASKKEIEIGFNLIDSDNDDSIDFDEFLNWWETVWWQF